MTRSFPLFASVLTAVAITLCLGASMASANMASPYHAGRNVAEPFVELHDVHILREDLALDFTTLDTSSARDGRGSVPIVATYRLRNDGPGREIRLLFTTPALRSEGSGVWLDGVEIQSVVTGAGSMPVEWLPPSTTPGIDGAAMHYETKTDSGIYFSVFLPAGEHTIRVRTSAKPTAHSTGSSTVYWQLAYLLAPARNWASFDTLFVTARYPKEWKIAADPAMSGSNGELSATLVAPRQNALSFTLHGPEPSILDQTIYQILAAVASVGLSVYLGTRVGRKLRRRGTSRLWANIIAPVFGVLCGLVNFVLAMERSSVAIERAGRQAAWNVGYGDFLFGIVIFVVLFLVTDILFVLFSKRAYRAEA